MSRILILGLVACLVTCLAAGCSKQRQVTPASREQCTLAIDRSVGLAITKRKQELDAARAAKGIPSLTGAGPAIDAQGTRMKSTLVERCVGDRWGTAVVTCFQTALDIAACFWCASTSATIRCASGRHTSS
ncbi:MAG: hypothetical protein WKG01_35915, partial [Kofleriaceae bacterium]